MATHAQVGRIRTHNEIDLLLDRVTFRRGLRCKVACSVVSFTDCGRVMRDIIFSVLCGATMGLSIAMVGECF